MKKKSVNMYHMIPFLPFIVLVLAVIVAMHHVITYY